MDTHSRLTDELAPLRRRGGGPARSGGVRLAAMVLIGALLTSACADGDSADRSDGDDSAPDGGSDPTATDEGADEEAEAAELPGGGDTLFPDRRFVALYGSPGIPALGALGEQDVDAAVDRIEAKVEDYQEHSDEPVQPAFEIITTVATEAPGADGNYTNEIDPETLRPWIDAAEEAEVYVVLDLQPGRADFLSQAQAYEDLLREPHVGLALDPEWRIAPDQVHGTQIGSVDAAEINEVSDWLAELTASEDLPQKMLILHQFTDAMIRDRGDIDTSHEELAITLHADGHGTPESKMETWERLQQDLPEGIWMAWKNFHRQDRPTFTPEETYEVEPKPWFVSYQ